MRAAWLVMTTRDHEAIGLRIYSEPCPTHRADEVRHVVAVGHGSTYQSAHARLSRWWSNRKPWQKRALLSNATVKGWSPPEIV